MKYWFSNNTCKSQCPLTGGYYEREVSTIEFQCLGTRLHFQLEESPARLPSEFFEMPPLHLRVLCISPDLVKTAQSRKKSIILSQTHTLI